MDNGVGHRQQGYPGSRQPHSPTYRVSTIMLAIYPLSPATLGSAIDLTKRVFDRPGFWWEQPGFVLWLSLRRNFVARSIFRLLGMGEARYWVVADETGLVLGVTGLYTYLNDPDACWLGWTCVDPEARSRRIGSQLVDFAIAQSQSTGRSYLRLYTWDGEEAAVARHLYQRRGFQLTRTEKLESYSLLYYELPVQQG
ncbi:hypothetical protein BST81_12520 [Leptolyngbya sp. 'hensonii']|uniref:GNAT family N-acetyltransferase n=1 Tax=Leptolyngbya sp. 'hensonii' TaxID=1922337 RepID=UPI00094FD417|nr:GNAT family N-acetyltransferase [Leptolyngbya sp. 'hensonii']OLP17877.1 hypothetical protein BST81_12520 [Leptolyngbya sp. 'hensonii']